MIKLDYEEVYKWALEAQEPFTAYKFEQRFSLGRNSGARFLNTPAFEETPVVSNKHYYQLSVAGRESLDEFKRLLSMRPVTRSRKPLGLIWTAFGRKDLSVKPYLPSNYKELYAYFGVYEPQIGKFLRNCTKLAQMIDDATPEQIEKLVNDMAEIYPVITTLQSFMYEVFTDPRVEDKAVAKEALRGNSR